MLYKHVCILIKCALADIYLPSLCKCVLARTRAHVDQLLLTVRLGYSSARADLRLPSLCARASCALVQLEVTLCWLRWRVCACVTDLQVIETRPPWHCFDVLVGSSCPCLLMLRWPCSLKGKPEVFNIHFQQFLYVLHLPYFVQRPIKYLLSANLESDWTKVFHCIQSKTISFSLKAYYWCKWYTITPWLATMCWL